MTDFESEFAFKSISSTFEKMEIQSTEILEIIGKSFPDKIKDENTEEESRPTVIFKSSIAKKAIILENPLPPNESTKSPELILEENEPPKTITIPKKTIAQKIKENSAKYNPETINDWHKPNGESLPVSNLKLGTKRGDTKKSDTLDLDTFDIHKFKQHTIGDDNETNEENKPKKYDAFNSLDNNFI